MVFSENLHSPCLCRLLPGFLFLDSGLGSRPITEGQSRKIAQLIWYQKVSHSYESFLSSHIVLQLYSRPSKCSGLLTARTGGRLGNQLSQYANLFLLSNQTGFKPVLPKVVKDSLTRRLFKNLSLPTRRQYKYASNNLTLWSICSSCSSVLGAISRPICGSLTRNVSLSMRLV